jgi:replicative DNA helicase
MLTLTKKYPYNHDFQLGVVALLILDPGFRSQYADLVQPRHFDDDSLHTITDLCQKLIKRKVSITKESVDNELEDYCSTRRVGKTFKRRTLDLIEEASQMDLEYLDYIPDKVLQFARNQSVASALLKATQLLQHGKDPEPIRNIIDKAMMVGASRDVGISFREASSDVEYLRRMREISEKGKVPTGLERLDKTMRGGLSIGELGMVIGPTGRGKSIILINFAAAGLIAGKNVVYITFELRVSEVLTRMMQNLTGSTVEEVEAETPTFRDKMDNFNNKYPNNLQIKFYNPGELSSIQLRAYLARLQAHKGWSPDLIILDDADSMKLTKAGGDGTAMATYQALGTLYSDLLCIINDFECACWCACQATRNAFDAEVVTLSHTADSFKKAHKSHIGLCVCQTKEEEEREEARLFIAKARNYKSGFFVPIKFEKEKMLIEGRENGEVKDRKQIVNNIRERRKEQEEEEGEKKVKGINGTSRADILKKARKKNAKQA